MSDTAYPVFQHYGTNAQRLAFTPSPASGTQPIYIWYETDTGNTYLYSTAWHQIASGGTSGQADSASVNTQESTSSTSYVDLTTTGPSVTLTTGTSVIVFLACWALKSTTGNSGFMSVAVSGATTVAASDGNGSEATATFAGGAVTIAAIRKLTGLTAGSNTFKAQYRVDGGTFTFAQRSIAVFTL